MWSVDWEEAAKVTLVDLVYILPARKVPGVGSVVELGWKTGVVRRK
jgi:hypothetical protein